jgi:hypothetical protein
MRWTIFVRACGAGGDSSARHELSGSDRRSRNAADCHRDGAWGHGTLYYSKDQKEYKFKISGVSVADVGAAGITAEGEVYNLTSPADLSGNYSAVTAGLTVIEGGSVAYLKNDNGVVIKLHSQTGGLRFNLSANGMHITLQQ